MEGLQRLVPSAQNIVVVVPHKLVNWFVQWNHNYPNPMGPGMVHKSEKSVFLKLCIK